MSKTLTDEQYNLLQLNNRKYHALMAEGVDNWPGYDEAMKKLTKDTLNAKTTHIHFILDNSGSMQSILGATISGFNEYIENLQKDDLDYTMTLVKFGDKVEKVFENVNLKYVEKLTEKTYSANGGMTALYDAVCKTLEPLKDVKKDEDKHLVVIMTDGGENASQEFTETHLNNMKKNLENKGNFTFVFLGANQDSYAVASKFGFGKGNTANFNASNVGVKSVMDNMARSTAVYAAASAGGFTGQSVEDSFYTDDQKKDMEESK